ncbi:General stress protein 69 [Actinomadura rubteroloni]|uniref:General stress protein 69 n=1 Tax=Actinomadura rubteroloni TaxID=1926885 RepID=A0A2P4UCZ4_9ACTN|nr:aldo/keto reductase [Actinomadura rubteroloni]POM22918.1 General stress protein 69 [Actinomadura rubteroloni]
MADLKTIGSLDVFPLALGGNVFGWTADRATSFAVLDGYVAGGGNFVDTADVYSAFAPGNRGGESETIIGEWLAARGNRDDVVIATKAARHPDYMGLKPETLKAAADASLRRLGTDRIDLFYTHFDDPDVPVEEIVTALDDLVRAGKVREIAASNIEPDRLAASVAFSEAEGKARYVALQPHYNLVERDAYEGPLLDTAARLGLVPLPYFALAAGFLTGKYRPGQTVDSARAGRAAQYLETERGPKVLAALDAVARDRDVPIPSIALAWLATRPTVVAPIASARTVGQLGPLLRFPGIELTAAEVDALTEASA